MTANYGPMSYDAEGRRKHLEFIQGVIARLSQSSATAKGWSLTLGGAAFGFSITQDRWHLALLAVVVLLAFSVVDAYYLHSERLFRDMYEDARKGNVEPFAMNPRAYDYFCRKVSTYFSWSVAGFYGGLVVIAGVGALVVART